MLKFFIAVCFVTYAAALSQDHCGSALLASESGSFSSPLYPRRYENRTVCQWIIRVSHGSSILIQFADLRTEPSAQQGLSGNGDYVSVVDVSDDSTLKYFNRSDGQKQFFLSKSNLVVATFVSLGPTRLLFNATYKAVNDEDFCDKNQLRSDHKIDVDQTDCVSEGKAGHFATCNVACSSGYTPNQDSKVVCQKGKFTPKKPCILINWEVELCKITNMEYCIYTVQELVDHWTSDDEIFKDRVTQSPNNDYINIDQVPMFQDNRISKAMHPPKTIDVQRRTSMDIASQIQRMCFSRRQYRSYCARTEDGNYAFNCETATMMACLHCRSIGCTSTLYI